MKIHQDRLQNIIGASTTALIPSYSHRSSFPVKIEFVTMLATSNKFTDGGSDSDLHHWLLGCH